MFGYVRADKPEMRIREYEYYRGVYCGLCRSMGKCCGQCSRLTLSYDFAFMALVRMAIVGEKPEFKPRKCIAHPFKKRAMAEISPSLKYCASASVLLSYYKIKDDITDERGGKRFFAKLLKPFFGKMKRRSAKKYKELGDRIEESLLELSKIEKDSECVSLDRPAETFGSLLAVIMSYELEGAEKKIAEKIGYHLGKWIYIIDAADDYEEDVKKSRYNPIARVYGEEGLDGEAAERISVALTCELSEAEKGFDLIEYPTVDMKEIVSNIIYLGMPAVAKETIKKTERKDRCADEGSV